MRYRGVATVSTVRRLWQSKYISRVEVSTQGRGSGSGTRPTEVDFISEACTSVDESRQQALDHCRKLRLKVTLITEIEDLSENVHAGRKNGEAESVPELWDRDDNSESVEMD